MPAYNILCQNTEDHNLKIPAVTFCKLTYSGFYKVLKLSDQYQVSLTLTYIITWNMANPPNYLNVTCQRLLCFCSPESRLQMQCKYQCSILCFCAMYGWILIIFPVLSQIQIFPNMPVPNTKIQIHIISLFHSRWKRTSSGVMLVEKHYW